MKHFIIGCIAFAAISCHSSNESVAHTDKGTVIDENATQLVSDSTSAVGVSSANQPAIVLQSGSPEWEKKIIKTANLNLELKDYNSFNTAVHQSLKSFGAYIAQEQQLQSGGEISNTISIKVPVDQFEHLMNHLSSLDRNVKVIDKQISSEDVSTQIVDTKSRIETKKKLRDKYFELMGQSKKMDDVIRVQNEINSITEDIEAASGRVEFMSHQSSYSTINLKYFQVLNGAGVDDTSPNFFTNIVNEFKQGGSIITNVFLFLVNIWPLLAAAAVAWSVFRKKALKPARQSAS
jgi:hypothetical protein